MKEENARPAPEDACHSWGVSSPQQALHPAVFRDPCPGRHNTRVWVSVLEPTSREATAACRGCRTECYRRQARGFSRDLICPKPRGGGGAQPPLARTHRLRARAERTLGRGARSLLGFYLDPGMDLTPTVAAIGQNTSGLFKKSPHQQGASRVHQRRSHGETRLRICGQSDTDTRTTGAGTWKRERGIRAVGSHLPNLRHTGLRV